MDTSTDWCASCVPLAREASAGLANLGLDRQILEKLIAARVRGKLSGTVSGVCFAGGSEYQACTCCSKISGRGDA